LNGIRFDANSLAGGNFTGQNLTNAGFVLATLTEAHFSEANLTDASLNAAKLEGADFTQANLTKARFGPTSVGNVQTIGARLTRANFTDANLRGASFNGATLTDADFTRADVRGANLSISCGFLCRGTGIALEQLYSTESYQEHDLRGVSGVDLSNAVTTNLILPNGHLAGLDLHGGLLVVRDYDGYPTRIPITVDQHLAMGPGGTLRIVLEADAWDSTISFAPGIPVTLGGTLELTFAADVNPATQVGRTIDLFNWTGVAPIGAFAVSSPYAWDLSNLYTTGQVTLTAVPEPGTLFLVVACSLLSVAGFLRRFRV
jgi:uncharacterized protein YjbI with pentapeptide repeats